MQRRTDFGVRALDFTADHLGARAVASRASTLRRSRDMTGLLIVGAGGHGKVVADAACETRRWDRLAFLDDAPFDDIFGRWPILGNIDSIASHRSQYSAVVVALGDNPLR